MPKRFNVVFPKEDGGIEVYLMKEWLRQHPQEIPPGLDATASTSHQLRDGLKKLGWTVQETESEVRLFMPGTARLQNEVNTILGEDNEQEDIETPEASFALEYQLRDFIAQNLHTIQVDGKRLRLYIDPTGREGVEFPTAVGPIDILTTDDVGNFFVFELKRGRTPDHAIGQLARYMGWVKQTIGKSKEVYGVIVAKIITSNLHYSASVIPNISLFEYEVVFNLKSSQQK